MKYTDLPVKEKIQKTYESYIPYLDAVMHNIEKRLKKNILLSSTPTYKLDVPYDKQAENTWCVPASVLMCSRYFAEDFDDYE
ncbi:MAG: hypothetical protein IKI31_00395 [Treponema sp.]|nr:hypothetical protein [Treponema sp.]